MAENGSNGAANGANSGGALPQLNVLVQYTKDLSFENPNAPRSLAPQNEPPNISIQVNVNANQLNDTDFDVNLMLEGSAGEGNNVLFKFELTYGGVFKLQNIPQNEIHPVVWIECPRLLFPFARQIVADAVRNGGFPPLLLDPIDFVALYRQRMEQLQAGAATA
ncbi:MAG TPA: protein-export chaperone SecB [Beijerinckiaceae bacterium]|jgi:preprotein translocase subunit SecB|nr:protein-export chaperone SecB [Beijerinckiaceae bacterium]